MFNHKRHNLIVEILRSSHTELFEEACCFFAGGTAATLLHGEYRLSNDIDFLCDVQSGYRAIRALVNQGQGLATLFPCVKPIRDCRIDQYGVRQFVEFKGEQFKIEIVREGNVSPLSGSQHEEFGVLTLDLASLTATKLTANADRWRDLGVGSRDIVDLAFIAHRYGELPQKGIHLAGEAYGLEQILRPLRSAAEQTLQTTRLLEVCHGLAINEQNQAHLSRGLAKLLELEL